MRSHCCILDYLLQIVFLGGSMSVSAASHHSFELSTGQGGVNRLVGGVDVPLLSLDATAVRGAMSWRMFFWFLSAYV